VNNHTRFDIVATIPKAAIAALAASKGKVLAVPAAIDGDEYEAGHVRFLGFAGSLDVTDGLYHGFHRLEVLAEAEEPDLLFTSLPGMETPPPAELPLDEESEVDDGDGGSPAD
jgi:hypothetical protein